MDPKTKAQEVYIAAVFDDLDKISDRLSDTNAKLAHSLGAIVKAVDALNTSADKLVDKKLIDLDSQVNNSFCTTITRIIEQSMNSAVAKELQGLTWEIGSLTADLRNLHERTAQKAGHRQLFAAIGAGALASLLTLLAAGWAVKTGIIPIDIRVDSASVAQTVLSGMKQRPKAR